MDSWSSGRVALVGDAAYCPSPMSGMGTSLALVGAYVLAGELATADSDHRAAFGRYEKEMRGYVSRGQEQVKGASGFLLPKSRPQVWLRNQAIRMLPYMPRKVLIAGGVQKAANAIALKVYPPSRQHRGVG
jgi:2-polyprenyl-6-methoxyphenol hydroxylase-like FAD-dependent oxidoreductase